MTRSMQLTALPRSLAAALLALSFAACAADTPPPPAARTVVTVRSTIRHLFSPPGPPQAVTAANMAPDCSGVVATRVQLFDVLALAFTGATAAPLGTCDSDPATGGIECTDIDLTDVGVGVMATIVNAPDASRCIAPTLAFAFPCPTGGCAGAPQLTDGVLSEDEMVPLSVLSQATVDRFDAALATTPAHAGFGGLQDSGALLNIVLGTDGMPRANAKPYLPLSCNTPAGNGCRATLLAVGPMGPSVVTDPAISKTDVSGMWLLQLTRKNMAGEPINVPPPQEAQTQPELGVSAIDCSGAAPPACFASVGGKTVRRGELGMDQPGFIAINPIPPTPPAADGGCAVLQAASAAGASAARMDCASAAFE